MGAIAALAPATKAMLALTAASTAISAAGAKRQSDFQRAQFRSAQVQNEQLAQDALARGQEQERAVREEGDALRARQGTGFRAGGFLTDAGGSPLDIISSTAGINTLEYLNVRRDALLQAQGFDFQARDLGLRRDLARGNRNLEFGSTFINGGLNATTAYMNRRK